MNLHEYQSKALFAEYGIPVPQGVAASTPDEAAAATETLGGDLWVVKAQVHAGGRGKAGGVKLVRSADEAREAAAGMLGTMMVTHQTGPEGQKVRQCYVERGSDIARELYLAVAVDRGHAAPVMIASAEGGMDIEELAAEKPEAILREVQRHPVRRAAHQHDNIGKRRHGGEQRHQRVVGHAQQTRERHNRRHQHLLSASAMTQASPRRVERRYTLCTTPSTSACSVDAATHFGDETRAEAADDGASSLSLSMAPLASDE